MKKKRVNVLKTTKKLKSKLWILVSEFVRRSVSNKLGYGTCYTCGTIIHWKAGHCAHRYHGTLDFDIRNLKLCCVRCNKWLHGNLGEYEKRLIRENGLAWSKKLEIDAARNRGYVYKILELEELIKVYQQKLEELNV